MKKFLLSLAVVVASCFGAAAETLSFTDWEFPGAEDWGSGYAKHEVVFDNAIVTFESANKQAANATISDCPVTKGAKITVSAKNNMAFSAVTFNLKAWGTKKQTATLYLSTDGETFTATETKSDNFVLEGKDFPAGVIAAQVQFSSSSNQVGLSSIDVTFGGAAADLKPAELKWSESAVTVYEDKIAEFTAPTLSNPNNLAVVYSSSDENVAEISEAGVVTLNGDPGVATIKASFAGNDEFRAAEVSYTITVKATPKTVGSVAETIALAAKTEAIINYELTVGYVNYNNVFACDAAGKFIQIYGKNSYKVGDKVPAGWNATYLLYNGVTPELEPIGAMPAGTAGTFEAKAVAAADVNNSLVNSVVVLENVVFAAATPSTKDNFTGKVGETEFSFRNNYGVAAVEAGTYNVTVVVTLFKATGATEYTPSLYVVEYKTAGGQDPDPIVPEETKVKNLEEAFALESGTKVTVDCALTVGFVNNKNIFVRDEAGDFIQIYGENSYKVGDVIPAGWKATYSVRNGAPQFAPDGTLPAATEGTFTPEVVAAADVTKDIVNHVIVVKDVVIAEATPGKDVTDNNAKNFTGKVGDVTLSFRNNYGLESVEAGTYNITLWVNLFNGNLSLYVISFEKAGSTGIDEIEAVDGAEAVYYNLQGVRVENPENGIFIVRRGNKVSKEMIR